MTPDPVIPSLNLLCRATVELGAPLLIGPIPLGERQIIPITGGRVEGERLGGEVLPGGADWQIVRADGAVVLEARYLCAHRQRCARLVENKGLRAGPPDVLARLARGEHVAPDEHQTWSVRSLSAKRG